MDKSKTIDIDMRVFTRVPAIIQRFLTPNGGLPVVLLVLGDDAQPIPDSIGYGCTTTDEFIAALKAIYKLSPCHTARLVPAEQAVS